ncbi:MAG: 30S ribosomal protein S8 [Candidatus Omnitrophota bacterium]
MSRSDMIADALTAIMNASKIKKENVDIMINSVVKSILEILKKESYIENFQALDSKYNKMRVYLKYDQEKNPAITSLKRVSRPGLRVYVKKDKIPIVLRGQGIAILSTPSGIISSKEAKEKGLGGEVVCSIY